MVPSSLSLPLVVMVGFFSAVVTDKTFGRLSVSGGCTWRPSHQFGTADVGLVMRMVSSEVRRI